MKNEILTALRKSGDGYLSGEMISQMLGVSRTAIWKHIKQLKEEGYVIESVTHKGYRLIESPIDLDEAQLSHALANSCFIEGVYYMDTVDSTNLEAKRIESKHPSGNAFIYAREQTLGKGRMGRSWESKKDEGLWMSLLLRPKVRPEMASQITLIAAAAVAEAIDKVAGVSTGIKWPNDVVLKGKKISGILTEMSAELNQVHYIVLGVGINISQMEFNDLLNDKATSLKLVTGKEPSKLNLIKEFVQSFEMYYNQFVSEFSAQKAVEFNRTKSVTVGKQVYIVREGMAIVAYANAIDDAGRLIVTYADGQTEAIHYGEVSVRGINGYVPS
jgi:BirA family transcriptional regulator, biotin operon repressor / biotin---[acetyl-CoA-carboxylase] ligase